MKARRRRKKNLDESPRKAKSFKTKARKTKKVFDESPPQAKIFIFGNDFITSTYKYKSRWSAAPKGSKTRATRRLFFDKVKGVPAFPKGVPGPLRLYGNSSTGYTPLPISEMYHRPTFLFLEKFVNNVKI